MLIGGYFKFVDVWFIFVINKDFCVFCKVGEFCWDLYYCLVVIDFDFLEF